MARRSVAARSASRRTWMSGDGPGGESGAGPGAGPTVASPGHRWGRRPEDRPHDRTGNRTGNRRTSARPFARPAGPPSGAAPSTHFHACKNSSVASRPDNPKGRAPPFGGARCKRLFRAVGTRLTRKRTKSEHSGCDFDHARSQSGRGKSEPPLKIGALHQCPVFTGKRTMTASPANVCM